MTALLTVNFAAIHVYGGHIGTRSVQPLLHHLG